MSHYAVAVIHSADQSVCDLLAPYNEAEEVETCLLYTREGAIEYARRRFTGMESRTDEECWSKVAHGYHTDDDGNIYATYNPQSKWDWWDTGGQYCGMLRVGDRRVDEARIGDVDFSPDMEKYEGALKWWDTNVDVKPDPDGDPIELLSNKSECNQKRFMRMYGDRESYALHAAAFSTYAVVTPDGEWHAPGEVDGFGLSSETDEEWIDWCKNYVRNFIEPADPDLIITIVDCNI